MTLVKALPMLMMLAIGSAAYSRSTPILAASIDDATPASEADVTYFYKNPSPERLAKIMVFLNTLSLPDKWSAQASTIWRRRPERGKAYPIWIKPKVLGW